ncbi:MAG: hypothetical protein J2P17_04870, partial [Mycobacterium sp.]|nr:hypothetical protein [Mycobacterium sp.]
AGHVTAQHLRHYHWSALPPAPIAVRSSAASLWTGQQMLVWAGAAHAQYYADGAAYTPTSRTWQTLPLAPLSARADPYAIWTGSVMIVWGGHTGSRQFHDGAMYNPVTNRWTIMAEAAPAANGATYDFAWGGHFAVRLSLNRYFAATKVQVDAFDPANNIWTALPAIHVPSVNNYTGRPRHKSGPDSSCGPPTATVFALNPAGTRGQPVPYSPDSAGCMYQAIPTATSISYPANYGSVSCGGDAAFGPSVRGTDLNLATG